MGATLGKAFGLKGEIPQGLGPYAVGTAVFRPGKDCPLVQAFYPAGDASGLEEQEPYMRPEAATGLAQWLGLGRISFVFRGSLKKIKHPFLREAPLHSDFRHNKRLPVVLFSHGLGGTLELYSKTCGDLASYGYLVLAMEHEDQSGCYSLPENHNEPLYYKQPDASIEYTRENVQEFRRPFLEHRRKEIVAVLDDLSRRSKGDQVVGLGDVMIADVPNDSPASQGDEWEEKTTQSLVDRLMSRVDHSEIHLSGHSFGGASSVFSSHDPSVRQSVKSCILFDVWPFPIPDKHVEQGMRHDTLSILSEQFVLNDESPITLQLMRSTEAKAGAEDIDVGSKTASPNSTFLSFFLPGTTHQQFSDTPWWQSPSLAKRTYAVGELKPELSQAAMISACVAFLQGHRDLSHVPYLAPFTSHASESN